MLQQLYFAHDNGNRFSFPWSRGLAHFGPLCPTTSTSVIAMPQKHKTTLPIIIMLSVDVSLLKRGTRNIIL